MSKWTPIYSKLQRAAIEHAYCHLRIRPASLIGRMARAGELELDGERVPAFEIPDASVRYIGKAADRRKAGLAAPDRDAPPRVRADRMRRRLEALIDQELTRLETATRRKKREDRDPLDGEHLRKIARALRELSTIPAPDELRLPRTPGEHAGVGVSKPDGTTRDDMAGSILRASDRMGPSSATNGRQHQNDESERINAPAPTETSTPAAPDAHGPELEHQHQHDESERAPGSSERAHIGGLSAAGVVVRESP